MTDDTRQINCPMCGKLTASMRRHILSCPGAPVSDITARAEAEGARCAAIINGEVCGQDPHAHREARCEQDCDRVTVPHIFQRSATNSGVPESVEQPSPCPCGSRIWVDGKFRGPNSPKHIHSSKDVPGSAEQPAPASAAATNSRGAESVTISFSVSLPKTNTVESVAEAFQAFVDYVKRSDGYPDKLLGNIPDASTKWVSPND